MKEDKTIKQRVEDRVDNMGDDNISDLIQNMIKTDGVFGTLTLAEVEAIPGPGLQYEQPENFELLSGDEQDAEMAKQMEAVMNYNAHIQARKPLFITNETKLLQLEDIWAGLSNHVFVMQPWVDASKPIGDFHRDGMKPVVYEVV